jgi:hypothetical protein
MRGRSCRSCSACPGARSGLASRCASSRARAATSRTRRDHPAPGHPPAAPDRGAQRHPPDPGHDLQGPPPRRGGEVTGRAMRIGDLRPASGATGRTSAAARAPRPDSAAPRARAQGPQGAHRRQDPAWFEGGRCRSSGASRSADSRTRTGSSTRSCRWRLAQAPANGVVDSAWLEAQTSCGAGPDQAAGRRGAEGRAHRAVEAASESARKAVERGGRSSSGPKAAPRRAEGEDA